MKRPLLLSSFLLLIFCILCSYANAQDIRHISRSGSYPIIFSRSRLILQVKDQQKVAAMLAAAGIIPERIDLLQSLNDVALLTFPQNTNASELQLAITRIRLDHNTVSAHPMLLGDDEKEEGGS